MFWFVFIINTEHLDLNALKCDNNVSVLFELKQVKSKETKLFIASDNRDLLTAQTSLHYFKKTYCAF